MSQIGENLPTIPRAVDNTAMSAYMHCPRDFKYTILDGWRAKERKQALAFGSIWHLLLEAHYKSGGDMNAVNMAFIDHENIVPNLGDYRNANRALTDYKAYRKKWNIEKDVRETVGFPNNPMVELSTAVMSDTINHEYAGKIDRVIEQEGLGYIEDHKTTSRLDSNYFSQFENSNQMMGYVWLGNKIVPDLKIVGVRINVSHVLTNKTEFHRHIVTYSPTRLAEWEQNAGLWMRRIEQSIQTGIFPAHFGDNGCKTVYGKCQFFDVCKSSPSIRQAALEQHFVIDPWDPLKHESRD